VICLIKGKGKGGSNRKRRSRESGRRLLKHGTRNLAALHTGILNRDNCKKRMCIERVNLLRKIKHIYSYFELLLLTMVIHSPCEHNLTMVKFEC